MKKRSTQPTGFGVRQSSAAFRARPSAAAFSNHFKGIQSLQSRCSRDSNQSKKSPIATLSLTRGNPNQTEVNRTKVKNLQNGELQLIAPNCS
jgi:hypothetical protein